MADEIDPQDTSGADAPEVEQPISEGGAPEAAEQPSFEEGMASAIAGALKDDEPAESEGPARGPDGRFTSKDGKPAEEKPAEQPESAKEKPEDDPYREPDGLKAEARERFQALAAKARESTAQVEAAQAELAQQRQVTDAFRQMLTETGASDQEFAAVLDFTRAVKAGNWQAAEPLLLNLVQQYRTATGRDVGGQTDPFAQHPDIAQALAEQKITPQHAQEIARQRAFMAQQQAQAQQYQARQQQDQRAEADRTHAAAQVGQMVKQWQATDLDWPRKQQMLHAKAEEIAQTYPAAQWPAAVKMAYDLISQTMQAAAPARQPTPPSQQPLRPSGASAGRREPSNMLEAISAALG